jgi:hypothetical protein
MLSHTSVTIFAKVTRKPLVGKRVSRLRKSAVFVHAQCFALKPEIALKQM